MEDQSAVLADINAMDLEELRAKAWRWFLEADSARIELSGLRKNRRKDTERLKGLRIRGELPHKKTCQHEHEYWDTYTDAQGCPYCRRNELMQLRNLLHHHGVPYGNG